MEKIKEAIMQGYENMTPVERSIADFFCKNEEKIDFSSRGIAKLLYISEATLSRFAKKCGYKGYREFIYDYEKQLQDALRERNISVLSRRVRGTYARLLEEEFAQLDEACVKRIAVRMGQCRKVIVCGLGSSGIAAQEFYLRFMRLGLDVQAQTDAQVISMTMAMADERTLVIALSLGGRTREILEALRTAKAQGAATVLLTANGQTAMREVSDEVLLLASDYEMDGGTAISPQFPLLMAIDVLYTYYLKNDAHGKMNRWRTTLLALRRGEAV